MGDAAINSGLRKMISEAVNMVCGESGYDGGISVVISAAVGAKLKKYLILALA